MCTSVIQCEVKFTSWGIYIDEHNCCNGNPLYLFMYWHCSNFMWTGCHGYRGIWACVTCIIVSQYWYLHAHTMWSMHRRSWVSNGKLIVNLIINCFSKAFAPASHCKPTCSFKRQVMYTEQMCPCTCVPNTWCRQSVRPLIWVYSANMTCAPPFNHLYLLSGKEGYRCYVYFSFMAVEWMDTLTKYSYSLLTCTTSTFG